MKRFLLAAWFVLSACLPWSVSAEEVIHRFDVTATLEPSRNVVIEETITYDFGDDERHGIYRFIPEYYLRNGATYRFRLKVIDVERDGSPEPYEESRESGNLNLKIGRADETITGPHAYRIRYATDRAVTSFDDHDELYWNVTGNEWPVPIEQSSITFILPPAGDARTVTSTCYTGYAGSTEQACTSERLSAGVAVKATRVLMENEGLTAAFAFPKGIVRELTTWDWVRMVVQDNGILLFPLIALLVMGRMWWVKGRDPKKGTIIPEYEPPQGLSPALVAAARTNGSVPPKAVTATIIDLARRGYLKIRIEDEKRLGGLLGTTQKFTFVRTDREFSMTMPEEERTILNGLFAGGPEQTVEDLKKEKFYTHVSSFNKAVKDRITDLKVFDANPEAVRGAYILVAVILGWGLLFFFGSLPLGVASAVATGAIVALFGIFMPRRTASGIKLLTGIEGFKWFLSVTEKDRMSFHNAPERKPEQFQELLPYAIALDVEKQWAAQFESMHLPPPNWAEGSAVAHFSTASFVSSLDQMHASSSSGAYSAPSSGGSGFSGGSSGGGGGGGGGGSW